MEPARSVRLSQVYPSVDCRGDRYDAAATTGPVGGACSHCLSVVPVELNIRRPARACRLVRVRPSDCAGQQLPRPSYRQPNNRTSLTLLFSRVIVPL